MIKLRPYQRDLLQQVQTALAADAKARVMMQLPTGGGQNRYRRSTAGRLAHGRAQGGLADTPPGTCRADVSDAGQCPHFGHNGT